MWSCLTEALLPATWGNTLKKRRKKRKRLRSVQPLIVADWVMFVEPSRIYILYIFYVLFYILRCLLLCFPKENWYFWFHFSVFSALFYKRELIPPANFACVFIFLFSFFNCFLQKRINIFCCVFSKIELIFSVVFSKRELIPPARRQHVFRIIDARHLSA